MNAGDLCNREVITTTRDASIQHVARIMRDQHVGCVIIIEEIAGHVSPVGILTDRDIVVEVLAQDIPVVNVTAGDVMSFALLKVSEDDSVSEVAVRMRSRGVRRVPVVSPSGELTGILALDDILGHISEELSLLATAIRREVEQESDKRPAKR
jgi:CBS domain-containing protein